MGAGIAVVVVVVGLFATWMLSPRFRQMLLSTASEEEGPKTVEPHQAATDPASPGTTPEKLPDPTPPAGDAPAVQVADKEAKLKGARTAMEAREFDRAVDILESITNPDGTRPGDVEDLLTQARTELTAKKALGLAQRELGAGRYNQAETLLAQAQGTVSFIKEYEQLKAKLDAAVGRGKKPAQTAASSPEAVEEAKRLYEEGYTLVKKKQYKEAQSFFVKCLELDKTFARCHMLLGTTYARLREPELGARHYRLFVKLAPEDPDAERVRSLLEQYDRSRREQ